MTFPLLRGWSILDCDEVLLFEEVNCSGRHRELLWWVCIQSTVSFCQRYTGITVQLELEPLPGFYPSFEADGWVMFFTVSTWLRNTSLFWQKRTSATFYVFTLFDSHTIAMYFSTQSVTLWKFQLARSRVTHALINTSCCEHIQSTPTIKVASYKAKCEVLVLPRDKMFERSAKLPKLMLWST